MNILMFGWEFPPQITGGLGVACFGLVRGFRDIGDTNITFVLPKLHGGEDHRLARLVSLDEADRCNLRGNNSQSVVSPYENAPWLCTSAKKTNVDLEISRSFDATLTVSRSNYDKQSIADALTYARLAAKLDLARERFDVIHAHDWLTFLAAIEVKKVSGKPLVVHIHSTELDRASTRINTDIFDIEKFGMQAADKIVAVSELTRREIINHYGIDPSKVVTVYNAAEPIVQEPMQEKSSKREGGYLVSFVGRLTHQKGPKYFIEAAHRILQKRRDVRFVMAGTGDLSPMLKALASSYGIADKILFPGFLNAAEVTSLLAETDIYLMPSVSEPFGIAALEAIHANVPIVVTNRCGITEVIQSLISVEVQDSDAMADAVNFLLSDPERASLQSATAKREASELQWTKSASSLLGIYKSIC